MKTAEEIALNHHEWWDGTGYPSGLKGEVIPLSARLMALADVCDALQRPREYRPALDLEQTVRIIREGSGTHFDPGVVEAFLVCLDQFSEIAVRYADVPSSRGSGLPCP
jgi:putative two-component system response regulator